MREEERVTISVLIRLIVRQQLDTNFQTIGEKMKKEK